jgi:hypothetical protein
MSYKVKVLKNKDSDFEKSIQKIIDVHNENVEVGHFEEQGVHYSGMTYPELLALHHRGIEGVFPPKQIITLLYFKLLSLDTPEVDEIKNQWLKNKDCKKLLENLGRYISKVEYDLFGRVSFPYMPPDATKTPLFETGDLRSKTAYKTSKDNKVKEIK